LSSRFPQFASIANLSLIEEQYQKFKENPENVDVSWKHFFEGMEFASLRTPQEGESSDGDALRVWRMIYAYRKFGHLLVPINPIATEAPKRPNELTLEGLGFSPEELEKPFPTCGFLKTSQACLKEIIDALEKTYAHQIGIEYMDLDNPEMEKWIQERIEPLFPFQLSIEEKTEILTKLNKANIFETFLNTKYVGQKRFSLEGNETLIPVLSQMIESFSEDGMEETVLAMAHRGRLNVLANILGKEYSFIFHEFESYYVPDISEGTGDVKYHKGFSADVKTRKGKNAHLYLCANPSHLESVDGVMMGVTRSKQVRKDDDDQTKIIPILMHGDAALSGQGVVYETMQFGKIEGFSNGGTVHIVINNQIGFTTLPEEYQSTKYCTDIAKTFGTPVFHVNAEDPESCICAAKLACEIRNRFHVDVIIDLNGYRKYGHNEGDEPAFTQPLEYKLIRKKKTIREIYRDVLINRGDIEREIAEKLEAEFHSELQSHLEETKTFAEKPPKIVMKEEEAWTEFSQVSNEELFAQLPTAVKGERIIELTKKFTTIPQGFHLDPKLKRGFEKRLEQVTQDPEKPTIDWAMAEYIAFATLLDEKIPVRLSGQDSIRGTFNQRHAMWVDYETNKRYFPLQHLSEHQAHFDVFNSILSEYGVLAFEYGYSLGMPHALVMWEAQYGDFNNAAQVIVDQYIATSEQKWGKKSAVTLLLPHGAEGSGPEHSSARIERFLQLCGHDNFFVAIPTTPAQYFHLLRRQALRKLKRPLIVFTPKSLLRSAQCLSSLNDFTQGTFVEMIDDPHPIEKPKRLIFCAGKIFYEIIEEREKRKDKETAIVRVEQFYPTNEELLKKFFKKYEGLEECIWVQEEHSNMGGWDFMRPILREYLQGIPPKYVGRIRSASPAAGSHHLYKLQKQEILDKLF